MYMYKDQECMYRIRSAGYLRIVVLINILKSVHCFCGAMIAMYTRVAFVQVDVKAWGGLSKCRNDVKHDTDLLVNSP